MKNYIEKNYNENLIIFKKFCFKKYSKKLTNEEIEDLHQNSILKLLQCKSNLNNLILDKKAFFWITLRNDVVNYLKSNKYKKIITSQNFDNIEIVNIENEEPKYREDFLDILKEKMKENLNQSEYFLFINYTSNKISLKQTGVMMGYSSQSIYKKYKKIKEKIKKELETNYDLYKF